MYVTRTLLENYLGSETVQDLTTRLQNSPVQMEENLNLACQFATDYIDLILSAAGYLIPIQHHSYGATPQVYPLIHPTIQITAIYLAIRHLCQVFPSLNTSLYEKAIAEAEVTIERIRQNKIVFQYPRTEQYVYSAMSATPPNQIFKGPPSDWVKNTLSTNTRLL